MSVRPSSVTVSKSTSVASQRTDSKRIASTQRNPQRSVSPRSARIQGDVVKALKARGYLKERTVVPRVSSGNVVVPENVNDTRSLISKASVPNAQEEYTQWRSVTVQPFQKLAAASTVPVILREAVGGATCNVVTTPREKDQRVSLSDVDHREVLSPSTNRVGSDFPPNERQTRYMTGVSPDPRIHSMNPSNTRETSSNVVQPLNFVPCAGGGATGRRESRCSLATSTARYVPQPRGSVRPVVHSYRRASLKSAKRGAPMQPISFVDANQLSGRASATLSRNMKDTPTAERRPSGTPGYGGLRSMSIPYSPNPYINWTPLFTTNRPGHRFYLRSPSEGYPTNATTAMPSSRSVSVNC